MEKNNTSSNLNDYAIFKEKKDSLVKLIDQASKIIDEISLSQFAESLRMLRDKVNKDSFKIQIIGTFKNGKSTFINALLGEDILPAKVLPCTAVINEMKYGDKKKAILHFRNPLPDQLLADIPEVTLAHMKAHGMANVPPMEIPYDSIEDYVTIPLDGDPDEISLKSPYRAVTYSYPSEFLKEGVEIIDSPGLNENDERTAVTLEYLDVADAIIFLFDATKACAKDEMDTIETVLLPKGFEDIFFLVNRIDIVRPRERASVKEYVASKVKDYTTNEVFCISALQALDGKIDNDEELFKESGLGPFEERLTDFLLHDKGRIKLTQPARVLKGIIRNEALLNAIPSQMKALQTSTKVLQQRYEAIQPQLNASIQNRNAVENDLKLKINLKENAVRHAATLLFRDLNNQVVTWITNFTPKSKVTVFGTKKSVQAVVDEISSYVTAQTKEYVKKWNAEVLNPLLKESVNDIFASSEKSLENLLNNIDSIQAEITGTKPEAPEGSAWTRALGIAGICCGYVSGASLLSGQFDAKHLAKNLATDLAIGTAILALSIANPLLAIAGAIAVIVNSLVGGQKVVLRKVKEKLIDEINKANAEARESKVKEIVDQVDKEFTKLSSVALKAIDMKIEGLKKQIEDVIAEKEKGENETAKRMDLLSSKQKELGQICSELDDLVFALAENN